MKRAWTIKDIRGLIERYTPKTPKSYTIYFELRSSGTLDDNRYLISSNEVVNEETYNSFMDMMSEASESANPMPVLAKWLASHSNIRFRATGLLQKGNSMIPQIVFADETGSDLLVGCVDMSGTYEYQAQSASLYFGSIYGDGREI